LPEGQILKILFASRLLHDYFSIIKPKRFW